MVDVLAGIAGLVGPDADLASVLDEPLSNGLTAGQILQSGEWSQALLAAMDVINGPRPDRPGVRREREPREL